MQYNSDEFSHLKDMLLEAKTTKLGIYYIQKDEKSETFTNMINFLKVLT